MPANEIRVRRGVGIGRYLKRAWELLNSGADSDDTVVIKGVSNAVQSAVNLAELIKHRVKGLHQINKISNITIVDEYEPLYEGLDHLKFSRVVTMLQITLTKSENVDKSDIGYQPPIPESEVQEYNERERLGERRHGGREGGRGGNRRGGRRGGGGLRAGFRGRAGPGGDGRRRDDGRPGSDRRGERPPTQGDEKRRRGPRNRDDGYTQGGRRDDDQGGRGGRRDGGHRDNRDNRRPDYDSERPRRDGQRGGRRGGARGAGPRPGAERGGKTAPVGQ